MAALAPFPVDRRRTAIAITYENEELIADKVMPRVNSGGERFTWRKYRPGDTYRLQDVSVGRAGRPNEIEFGFDEFESKTEDYGLEDPIPQKDIDNAPQGYDPQDHATTMLTQHLLLAREKRVADIVGDVNNYAYNVNLSTSADKWSNYTIDEATPANESDPIDDIETGLRTMVRRANTMVMSEEVWSTLSRHPKIVSAFHGNDGRSGIATMDFVKQMFRIQNLYVGSAWVDTSIDTDLFGLGGLSRLWSKDVALLHLDPSANLRSGLTWGMTAQWKTRLTRNIFDPYIGLEGGQRVRVGEHVKEVVTASAYGYLIQNAIA